MGNWAELGNDILGLIVDQFSTIEDISHFGAVCRTWQSVSVEKWHLSIVDPWLMLVEKEDSDNRGFYSLSTKKVYHLNLPEARGRNCWSSVGWLITLGLDLEIHLLNPFSRSQLPIQLPPQPTLPDQFNIDVGPEFIRRVFIKRVILSSKPSKGAPYKDDDKKCIVMMIYSEWRKLAFLRLGDEVWTPVYTCEDRGGIDDVIYMNGQFYAVTYGAKLLMVDISSSDPKTIEIADPPEDIDICWDFYLVESGGELFMLAREVYKGYVRGEEGKEPEFIYDTDRFIVYRFNFENRKWTHMKSLDNRAMFVGSNDSFTIIPSNHSRCESNCVYYTDDDVSNLVTGIGGHDMGVFSMETNELDELYCGPDRFTSICTPLWICPSP